MRELTRDAMEGLRSSIFELRPAGLEADGLAATLRTHVEVLRRVQRQRLELTIEGEGRLPAEVEKGLLRIAQEALANALRHADARNVEIGLRFCDSTAALTVRDDGTGFDPEEARVRSRRLGLVSMRERAEALGAALSIDSGPGRGTRISVEVLRERAHPGSRR